MTNAVTWTQRKAFWDLFLSRFVYCLVAVNCVNQQMKSWKQDIDGRERAKCIWRVIQKMMFPGKLHIFWGMDTIIKNLFTREGKAQEWETQGETSALLLLSELGSFVVQLNIRMELSELPFQVIKFTKPTFSFPSMKISPGWHIISFLKVEANLQVIMYLHPYFCF